MVQHAVRRSQSLQCRRTAHEIYEIVCMPSRSDRTEYAVLLHKWPVLHIRCIKVLALFLILSLFWAQYTDMNSTCVYVDIYTDRFSHSRSVWIYWLRNCDPCMCVCIYIYIIYIYNVFISLRSISMQKYVWHSNGLLATATKQRNSKKLPIAAIMLFQFTQKHCLKSHIVPRYIAGDYF
jgi:hypothetical protein